MFENPGEGLRPSAADAHAPLCPQNVHTGQTLLTADVFYGQPLSIVKGLMLQVYYNKQ